MNWELNSDRPVWLQLVEHLQRAVVSGQLGPGSRVPPVRELASEAAVNPNTMQRALGELEAQGLLVAQRTSGRFVTQDTDRIGEVRRQLAQAQVKEFLDRMEKLGFDPAQTGRLVEEQLKEGEHETDIGMPGTL